ARQNAIEKQAEDLKQLNPQIEQATAERAALNAELGKYTGVSAQTQKDIDQLLFDQNRLQKQLDTIQPSLVKNYFLNAPLLDFMAPTLKVNQILTAPGTIVDDVNFAKVQKMDRCTTCHLAIDQK